MPNDLLFSKAIDWLLSGLILLIGWIARGISKRQDELDAKIAVVQRETAHSIKAEAGELRRAIDQNHSQVINILVNTRHPQE